MEAGYLKRLESIFFIGFAILLAVLSLLIARPYLHTAILALIVAYIVQPLYKALLGKIHPRRTRASMISTIIVIIFTLLIATLLLFAVIRIVSLVITQLTLIRSSSSSLETDLIGDVTNWLNGVFTGLKIPVTITTEQIITNVETYVSEILSFLVTIVRSIGTLSAGLVINLIVFYGLLFLVTPKFNEVFIFVKKLSPLKPDITEMYMLRAMDTAKAMVWGMLIISIVQAGIASLMFTILGIENVLLLTVVVAIFAFIPLLGTGMVNLALAAILVWEGSIVKAIILTAAQVILIGNIDTVLRAKLIPKSVQMPLVISFIAILGGVAFFGIWGLIYGPVIFSLLLATIELLKDEPPDTESKEDEPFQEATAKKVSAEIE